MATPDDLEQQQQLADAGAPPPKEGALENGRAPQPMGGMFTRSMDGWALSPDWLNQIAINDDRMLALEGYAPDLKLFDSLLDDDVAMSTFQQRRLDVISCDWVVEAGADDAKSKAAADHLRDQLKRISWDSICDKMLYSVWYGYAVAEPIYEIGADGLLQLQTIYVPNRAWFAFNNAGELRLRAHDQPEGLEVPDRKFWTIRSGGSHDGQHYGVGLAHWCYWPVYFKKNGLRFWALFLEKFGMPTLLGKFPPGWENDNEKLGQLLTALSAVGTDAAVIVPQDADVAPMEGQRGGSGSSSYKEFLDAMDAALTRIVLSQTMTSNAEAAGLGSGQANVHERKGLAVAQSDSDLLAESFNNSVAKWLTEWNFPGAAMPRVYRQLEQDESPDAIAARDKALDELGWERTEESFRETYGEGYQRKAAPVVPPVVQLPGQPPVNDNPAAARNAKAALAFAAHDPQPLYIQRKLLNGKELLDWAKAQGFTNLEAQDQLHVTVLYCPTPVDWFKLAASSYWASEKITVEAGGPRVVEPLGDKGVIVLQFSNWELESRHRDLTGGGCRSDDGEYAQHSFQNYWPHVTFAADATGVDLDKVEPFRGKLEFGPELWEPLDPPDGEALLNVPAVTFAADQLDAIDRLVLAMSAEGTRALQGMVAPIRDALQGMTSQTDPEALRVALLEALEKMPTAEFAAVLADPLLAVRAAEESGLGADSVA